MTDPSSTPSTHRPGSILGTRVLRTEDPGLLTGARRYLADLDLPNRLHAVFVRSDVAHGTIGEIHIEDAAGMPGVVEILTSAELGVAPHHGFAVVHEDFRRPPLADGKVRFVGEPIAVVLAETFEQGEDAAEMVWADITELPVHVDAEGALASGATSTSAWRSCPWSPTAAPPTSATTDGSPSGHRPRCRTGCTANSPVHSKWSRPTSA